MVSLAFEERGVNVVSVGNGEAAVRRIPDLNPDLVLADVFMPVRNGYEVCEFVKKDTRFAHVPVILLVGAWLSQYLGRSLLVWAVNENLPAPRRIVAAARVLIMFVAVVVVADTLNFARTVFLAAFMILVGGAVLTASLAAAPRCEDRSKPSLLLLPTFPASAVEGVLVEGGYLYLECKLHSILDGFGPNSLIIGEVLAASAREDALRDADRDEADQIYQFPILAYLSPGRLAEIRQTTAFPFPLGFSR
jgi:hypothetical protein